MVLAGLLPSLVAAAAPTAALTVQYRMDSQRAARVSERVSGAAVSSAGVSHYSRVQWREPVTPCRFRGGSAFSVVEADWAVSLVRSIRELQRTASIIVICLYRAQRDLVAPQLADDSRVQVLTGGQVQGSESDIVVLLTTNPVPTPFAVDPRLCHVVLTRDRGLLYLAASRDWLFATPAGRAVASLIGVDNVPPLAADKFIALIGRYERTASVASISDESVVRLARQVDAGTARVGVVPARGGVDWRGERIPLVLSTFSTSEAQAALCQATEGDPELSSLEWRAKAFDQHVRRADRPGPFAKLLRFLWTEPMPRGWREDLPSWSRYLVVAAEMAGVPVVATLEQLQCPPAGPFLLVLDTGIPLVETPSGCFVTSSTFLDQLYECGRARGGVSFWSGLPGQSRLDCKPAFYLGVAVGFGREDRWTGWIPLSCSRRSIMVSALQQVRAARLKEVEDAGRELIRHMAAGRYPEVRPWRVEGYVEFLKGLFGSSASDSFLHDMVAKVMMAGVLQVEDPLDTLRPVRRLMEVLTARDETPGIPRDATGGVSWALSCPAFFGGAAGSCSSTMRAGSRRCEPLMGTGSR